jgi:hypothetical protein
MSIGRIFYPAAKKCSYPKKDTKPRPTRRGFLLEEGAAGVAKLGGYV